MIKPRIILVGAGGHASSCIDVIEQHSQYEIAGLVGTPCELNNETLGYPVIGTEAQLPALSKTYSWALIAIGQINNPDNRIRLFHLIEELGFRAPTIGSPSAYVSPHAKIGPGTVVMHGATVNARATIGRNCILNSHSLIEHDAVVGNDCHIATRATINGDVSVGSGSFIGSGAVVRNKVKIGERCLIGMGRSLRHDLDDGTNYTSQKAKQ